ncbi:MAG: hypothetical protein LBJ71_01440, partial [Holosporaceae bacterium]|nr:hypothetical protein [Holosporaceae bacterium]
TNRVKIETLERKLSKENLWVSEYKLWKEVWAAISIKDISSRRTIYMFTIKCRGDFPCEFRVLLNDKVFIPTQKPAVDQDIILFHATCA